jgi:O-acetyl-ADP-ribose deacetylase (regulator of RNase III)
MPFTIIRNDITKMEVDAIVNPSNLKLKMGGGVSGVILAAANNKEIQKECDKIGFCDIGQAVITSAYNLPSKYIIHTVGPIWQDGSNEEPVLLYNCYKNSMKLAMDNNCESIAFPLISSGVYNYPKEKALSIAVNAITDFILEHDIMVYLVVYDKTAYQLSEKLIASVEKYIDDNYVIEHYDRSSRRASHNQMEYLQKYKQLNEELLTEASVQYSEAIEIDMPLEPTFSAVLLDYIVKKDKTSVEVYKKANIDKKLFAKIIGNKNYHPSKKTALALAISLELNIDQTLDFLKAAGYTLSHNNRADVIIEYFINEQNYDIFEINEVLFKYNHSPLGCY